jgi:hypothetical protein
MIIMKNFFKLSQIDIAGLPTDSVSINIDIPKIMQQMGLNDISALDKTGINFGTLATQLETAKDPRAEQAKAIATQIQGLKNSIQSFK